MIFMFQITTNQQKNTTIFSVGSFPPLHNGPPGLQFHRLEGIVAGSGATVLQLLRSADGKIWGKVEHGAPEGSHPKFLGIYRDSSLKQLHL